MPSPALAQKLLANCSKVIYGKEEQIKYILTVWLTGGHILIEDVPGTGKTVLAKTLAKSMGLPFGRIQFTPDLLPGDIVGTTIYNKEKNNFQFYEGPVFNSFVLSDEINRATPRTQSALLEAMAEYQVTVDGKTRNLDELFFVMATQNPIEHQGTFPLPEAQLDRFSMRISLGLPSSKDEIRMIQERLGKDPIKEVGVVTERKEMEEARKEVSKVKIHSSVYQYILDLVTATRKHPDLSTGAGPRASLNFAKCAQALAYIDGDDYVRPIHIYKLAPYILEHRVVLQPQVRLEGKNSSEIISDILKHTRAPTK